MPSAWTPHPRVSSVLQVGGVVAKLMSHGGSKRRLLVTGCTFSAFCTHAIASGTSLVLRNVSLLVLSIVVETYDTVTRIRDHEVVNPEHYPTLIHTIMQI